MAGLALLATVIVRLPTLFSGFYNPDETCYATIGQRLLEGDRLYLDIIDHKPPLIYYIYSLFALVGGSAAIFVAHAAMIAIVAATAIIVARIVKSLEMDDRAGWLCGILYIIGSALGKPNDVSAANAELIFNLPLAFCILFALRGRTAGLVASGLAGGIAILIKPHAIAGALAVFIWIVFDTEFSPPDRFKKIALLAASCAIPPLVAVILLNHAGSLDDAWYWGVTVNSLYMQGHEAGPSLLVRFAKQTIYMLSEEFAVCLPIILWPFMKKDGEKLFGRDGRLVAIWLIISALAIFPGGRFYGHYYLQILPPLCIVGSMAAWRLFSERPWRKWAVAAGAIIFAIPLGISFVWALPLKSFRAMLEPAQNAMLIDYLKQNTAPNERIEVWGRFNGIPFLAGRKNGARFLNKNLLSGSFRGKRLIKMPGAHWDMYFADLDRLKAEWYVEHFEMIDMGAPLEAFPRLSKYIADHYRQETIIGGNKVYRRNR